MRNSSGQSPARREDDRLLRGSASFVADLARGAVHLCFVRSTEAHARITSVLVDAARRLPGVHGVFTAADLGLQDAVLPILHKPHPQFERRTAFTMTDARLPVLASDRVSYVGQAIAVVVADTRHLAEDAAELVEVEYAPLVAVTDAAAALRGGPLAHGHLDGNEAASITVEIGDVDEAVRQAEHVVTGTYRMGRHGGVPLECRGALGRHDARRERIELFCTTQIPHKVRDAICAVTGWSRERLRIAVPDVGGGFGTKATIYPEDVVVAVCTDLLRRDVVWIEDRQEHLLSAAQSRDQVHNTRMAVDGGGRILAWEDDFLIDLGAGSSWVAGIIANTAVHLLGPYRIGNARLRGKAAFTNKATTSQYRGAGRPEACFALERSMDAVAQELGMSPEQVRRVNLLTADELPHRPGAVYRDGMPLAFDGGDYLACFEHALRLLGRDQLTDLAGDYPDHALGYGVASYIEATGRGPYETGRVELTTAGTFEVSAGSASAGQGHQTTLAQVVADAVCADPLSVTVSNGDTDLLEHGGGTFASRSAVVAGNAVHQAASQLVDMARVYAAELLDVDPEQVALARGGFSGPDEAHVGWPELGAAFAPGGPFEDRRPLSELAYFRPDTVTWTMGTHVAVVGVHRDSGLCTVLRYAVVHEGGNEIHPQIVDGQIVGGVAQGLGGALLEESPYTTEGQPLATTFADYLLPSTVDVPVVVVEHRQVPTSANPLGLRGAGESGTIAAYAVIASAVDDAVRDPAAVVRATPIASADLRSALAADADG